VRWLKAFWDWLSTLLRLARRARDKTLVFQDRNYLDNVRFAAHPARRRLKPSGYEVKAP